MLRVREAALAAVMSILKVPRFEPVATGDDLTSRGAEAATETAARLRKYWKTYGGLAFDQRMMNTLTDPKASFEAVREAADNLASLGEKRTLSTMVFSDRNEGSATQPNPAVAKFSKPTTAEAILAAMDRDLAHHAADEHDQLYDYHRRNIEDSYLGPLVRLGDKRIAPELAGRYRAATAVGIRRKYASACRALGDPMPLKAFATEVEKGSLKLPPNDDPNTNEDDQPGTVELGGIVASLVDGRLVECDRALDAIARPDHPYHALAVERVFRIDPRFAKETWVAHPFCLIILREALDDTTLTGVTWKIEGDRLVSLEKGGSGSRGLPEYLADPAARRPQAAERKCDEAAAKLGELVFGLPFYSPLLKDGEARLAMIKATMDRYGRHFRLLTDAEWRSLGLTMWHPMFLPDISPLDHPATPEDVERGRAVFDLGGKGKLAAVKLPAVASLRQGKANAQPQRALVVQAEVGRDGKTTYGIIGGGAIRAAAAEELSDIKPIAAKKQKIAK